MARKTGKIIRRGPSTWLVRIYVGRDSETRSRTYISKTIRGGLRAAQALSHELGGIAGIYNRAEYAEHRKEMLQWWADYVDLVVTENKVIVGNFGRQ